MGWWPCGGCGDCCTSGITLTIPAANNGDCSDCADCAGSWLLTHDAAFSGYNPITATSGWDCRYYRGALQPTSTWSCSNCTTATAMEWSAANVYIQSGRIYLSVWNYGTPGSCIGGQVDINQHIIDSDSHTLSPSFTDYDCGQSYTITLDSSIDILDEDAAVICTWPVGSVFTFS